MTVPALSGWWNGSFTVKEFPFMREFFIQQNEQSSYQVGKRGLFMQAIVETLFDAVYLTSVIAIGVTMIVKSRGNKEYWLFGIMAVVLGAGDAFHLVPRALALCTTGLENFIVPLGIGKFITSITMTIFYHHPLLCVAGPVQGQWSKRHYRRRVSAVCPADRPLLLPSECMAERQCAAFLGHLPEHSLCAFGPADHRLVLQERPAMQRTARSVICG